MKRNGPLRFLRTRQFLLAITTFVLVAAGTLFAAFLPNERFESTAVISVEPKGTDVSTQLVNFLIPTVEARIEGQSLAGQVAAQLPAGLAQSGWDVKTAVEPGSGVMRITVASDNRDVPMAAANAYAQTLDQAIPGTQVLDAVVIDPASRTAVVSSRTTILVSGLSLAVILAFLVAVAAGRSTPTSRVTTAPYNGSPSRLPADVEPSRHRYVETVQQ